LASLRRTLALRFAATMAAGLLVVAGAFYWAASRALSQPIPTAVLEGDLLIALLAVVVAGSAATLMGAWHFTSSAVRPVSEITAQATRIAAGTLDQRIVAHADTEEYEGLVAVLNRMLERLEQGFAARRRLLADVSHELRTPLTALRGEIEVALRSERAPQEYQKVLRSGLEEIAHLTTMCENLLTITRIDAGFLRPQASSTDLNALVRDVLRRFGERVERKNLRLATRLDPALRPVSLDAALIDRLVEHLLDNAVKFSPNHGEILVVTVPAAAGPRVSIADSGPGLPEGDRARMFEPFYRADVARTRASGAGGGGGLGLALSAAIARAHGGAISATTADGGGMRVDVQLPWTPPTPGGGDG
jgi:signal transduction histidine kinase